ncbi:exopolysaccharide biosynthesis protein [Rhizobium sp. DBTS2]|uniref:Exopolysaccharide biosynthesis protein n=1 Tax=Mycoplana rhizolycopersici TaxID=2746702 RepID=A0ABX2QDP0_9HYPH|nr:exopolysaccharide biosynthesis protein [Rhizobium rhizolycopersici]NVP54539.1 exopolysaccharide biosynthesis protein [Rhizobium rhizolycopersici]
MIDETPGDEFSNEAAGASEPPRRRFSTILSELADDTARERISVGDILAAMGDRAFGALMLIFALPNILPTPPGTSAILGAPLVVLTAQMTVGLKPWLPQVISNRSMLTKDFAAIVGRLQPWLQRAERLLRPRMSYLTTPPAEYFVGAVCLVLAVILFLPMPLGNILPALAISLAAFGILERDGAWVIAGLIFAVVAIIVVGGAIVAATLAFLLLLRQFML